ncbi:GRCR1-like protein [Mya arenaria]|uniref:GRCR1-like protein n=1 Tax=Mya arenaria TaxID=6604 RepID=A0ABY7DT77_MYAAR|nr:glutaredoxin domain-containing cysteine-rich protein CG31559-like [Mya arenaria]WAR00922.1 GRCR1-like protein [Mya arenaria]
MKVIIPAEVKSERASIALGLYLAAMAQDDSKVPGIRNSKDVLKLFKRSASEASFSALQHMERNYCKLGDVNLRPKDKNNLLPGGQIRVASLNALNSSEHDELNGDAPFAGRRDVSNRSTSKEKRIVSARGSIRGYKNRVRSGIATFHEENGYSNDTRKDEKGKIVMYTSSMMVVRQTADRCKAARHILQTHMVRYEERDLFMSAENQKELAERLGQEGVPLPQVFADGKYLGDFNDIQQMNETGELRSVFENFTKIQVRSHCDKCGGYRFLPCGFCHGSKKSLHRNEFTEEFCALRCMQCDENGLVRCDECIDQQE